MTRTNVSLLMLLAAGLAAACRTPKSDVPPADAADRGNLAELRALLTEGANVNQVDAVGWTPLIRSVRHDRRVLLTALLDAGADPNQPDERNRWNPLMHAIHRNMGEALGALLKFGADPNRHAPNGGLPLVMAVGYGYPSHVALLLDHGADPHLETGDGATALTAAVQGSFDLDRLTVGQCQTATVRTLLARAPDLQLGDGFRNNLALSLARWSGCDDILTLIGRG